MLIFLNTFDECQADKFSSPSLSAHPSLLHTHLSFSVLAFGLRRRRLNTNESIIILSYELLNIHLPIVSSRVIHAIGSQ